MKEMNTLVYKDVRILLTPSGFLTLILDRFT